MPLAMMSTSEQFNVRNVYRAVVSNNQTEALVSVFGFAFCFLFKRKTLLDDIANKCLLYQICVQKYL